VPMRAPLADPEYDPANQPPPAPYYWQETAAEAAQHPWWNKALQNMHYYGLKVRLAATFVYGVQLVAGFLFDLCVNS
jgi:hypothetical protein